MGRALVLVLALCGCRQVFGLDEPRPLGDAATTQSDGAELDGGLGPWSSPVRIMELAADTGEDDPSLTADQLEIYFGSARAGGLGGEDVWRATRTSVQSPWGTPSNVVELNTVFVETTAKVTSDGLAIFLTSTRTGGNLDVYLATRSDRAAQWGTPVRSDELSSADSESSASANMALTHVVLTSDSMGSDHLYVSDRASPAVSFSTPTVVSELVAANNHESDPFEPTTTALYYSMTGTTGDDDIVVAYRSDPSGPYGAPQPAIGVNMPGSNERDPWVSADERLIVFSSDRSGTTRLYYATR